MVSCILLQVFLLVVVLGYDILDFLDILGIFYSGFITYFIEFIFNLINKIYNLFNFKSIENIIQNVDKHIETNRVNRSNIKQESNLTKSIKNNTSKVLPDPLRPKYVVTPRPFFTYESFSLTDILTSKYFYIPVICILTYYGVSYHNEIYTTLSNSVLDLYNWWFNKGPTGGSNGTFNSINTIIDIQRPETPININPTTPISESIKIEEHWNNIKTSPSSSGSNTPTGPNRIEFDKYFK